MEDENKKNAANGGEIDQDQDPGAQGGGEADLDDDAYFESVTKEPVEAVPLERFKRVYGERKEHKAWRTEHEPKFGELSKKAEAYEKALGTLGERVGKHPHLKAALEQLLQSKDGSYDQKALFAAIKQEVDKLEGGDKGDGDKGGKNPEIEAIKAEIAQEREEREAFRIQQELDSAFKSLPNIIKADKTKAFEGIEVDEAFLAEVEEQLEADTARRQVDPKNVEGSLLKAAQKVAERWQKYSTKLLGKQVEGGKNGQGAASITPKGPAGKASKPKPDAQKDPAGYEKWLEELSKETERELGGGRR